MKKFQDIEIGKTFSLERFVSKKDVQDFARLTGDINPLHTNAKFAKKYKFANIVVHGMLGASFFSTLVGMHLPFKNCLYLSQSLKFHIALYPNQKITVLGIVISKSDALRILTLKTEVRNVQDQVIIDGEAKIKVLD